MADDILPETFWTLVQRGNRRDCWTWKGTIITGGYGVFRVGKVRKGAAHRVAWMLTHGRIPPGLLVCHKCDNPPCCNPAHLFLGTHAENVHDCIQKGRRARMLGSKHPMAKLTESDVTVIRRRRATGEGLKPIASDYAVTIQTISYIANRKIWSHV